MRDESLKSINNRKNQLDSLAKEKTCIVIEEKMELEDSFKRALLRQNKMGQGSK